MRFRDLAASDQIDVLCDLIKIMRCTRYDDHFAGSEVDFAADPQPVIYGLQKVIEAVELELNYRKDCDDDSPYQFCACNEDDQWLTVEEFLALYENEDGTPKNR